MRKFTIQWLLCITILFGLLSLQLKAQELFLNPSGTVFQLSGDIPEYQLPSFNIEEMLSEDSINIENNITPFRFAKKFDVNINPQNSGKWETIDGVKIWRCKISSANAFSMMTIFENLNLPDSSSLFIYNEDMTQIAGPFQSAFNQDVILPTELIDGASIIVELVVNASDQQELPYFTITSVSHDYWNLIDILNGNEKGKLAGKILKCHNDINCSEGDNWQTHKRAVAMIVVDGSALCTGSNINNTNFDGTPYFLTANHCYNGNTNVISRSVFYYNYEKEGCGGKKEKPYYTISGATLISNNSYTDFTLLRTNGGRVPSSYYPYFAGWDKTGNNPSNATVIHHPAGNTKKISIDNGTVFPNSIVRYGFQPGALLEVKLDNGTTEGGSSGAPLFNQNKKIVGQNYGGEKGCPSGEGILKAYGRLSVSWNHGSSSSTRLKEWLDPNNSNPNEILGYIPEGWRNDWLTGWSQPAAHKTHPQVKSIAVGEGNQVFYRGTDNKMQTYYWNSSTNQWVHDWVRGYSIPSYEYIAGDVVVGEGNQIFYRGTDGKIHTYYWTTSGWHHDWLTGWSSPSSENVSAVPGSIALGNGNQIFYRGTDNKMHTYYWDASGWHHAWIVNAAPSWQNVAGDIVVGKDGGHNQVYYRGTDGKMQVYWFNFSTNQWVHGWITGSGTPSYENVSSVAGSITVGGDNKIYYRGTDNFVHVHYFGSGSWHHGWMINGAGSDQKISGDITVNDDDQVFYRGFDGKMHVYWFNSATNLWVHDWIENSWQAPTLNNIAGSIDAGEGGQIFYRANNDGLVRVYFWGNSAMLRPSKRYNYGMDEVTTKPKIPMYNSTLEMTVYPNPVGDLLHINISSNQDDKYWFTLTDMSGRTVLSEIRQLNQGFNQIEVQIPNSVVNGLYILSVQNQRTSERVQAKITKL